MADSVVKFPASNKQKPTRYKPSMFMHNGQPEVLISAEEKRQLDAEAICERFSEDFIEKLRLMDDDAAMVVELLVGALFFCDDDLLGRAEKAAVSIQRRKKRGVL